jgi:hypothetical protein
MALLNPAHLSALAFGLLSVACVGTVTNQAEVFKPVSGIILLEVKPPETEPIVRVQFQAKGQVVGEDSDSKDGFGVELDTTTLPNGELVQIAAVGVRSNGSTVVLRENFILIDNKPSPRPSS